MDDKKEIEPGYITQVTYLRAVDGDTIEFEIKRIFHIRLRDIDVFEKTTDIGMEATNFVHNILSKSNEILVFVPANDPIKLGDTHSWNRIVGDVIVDGENLSDLLRERDMKNNPITKEDLENRGWYQVDSSTPFNKDKIYEHNHTSACLVFYEHGVCNVFAEVYDIGDLKNKEDFYKFCDSLGLHNDKD